jgi:hypothetical protein
MNRRYQGVTAYVGLPGSGKTYTLAAVGMRALDRGRRVWANVDHTGQRPWFNAPGVEAFRSFEEFAEIPNDAVILWDELPLFVNARKWQDFPDGLLYRLTQIRKDGLQLHFSTIDWRMVDVNVRRITFWTWECSHVVGAWHVRRLRPPEERRRKVRGKDERARATEFFRIRQDVRTTYDTFGKVQTFGALPPGSAGAVAATQEPPAPALPRGWQQGTTTPQRRQGRAPIRRPHT